MARYIDADALIEKIREKFKYNWEIPCTSEDRFIQEIVCQVYDLIYKQPIADVVGVKHCKWRKSGNIKECYACGFIYYSNHDTFNFCPECGAKMDLEGALDESI